MPFAIALSGLNAASADLGVIANNVANVNTNGFKGSRAEFAEVFAGSSNVGSGVQLANVSQQFEQGNFNFTENALDLAAGYDLVNDYDGVITRFDDVIGLHRLRMMHLNDSKAPFASKRDRHELIGEGAIGDVPFRRIMNDERLASVPKVLETPKLDDPEATDRRMLERLRSYESRD